MFIAMNRFKVIKGSEAAFENVWLSRDSHLEKVPGFVEFHLLKGPEAEDHLPREITEPLSFLRDRHRRGPTGLARSASAGGVPAIPENGLCGARHGR
jgi:antibiotic biosynthesis monooxygenase